MSQPRTFSTRGYDCDKRWREPEANNNIPVIPGRKNRKVVILYDKALYGLRSQIEIFFGKIKENKLFAVRYKKNSTKPSSHS